MEEQTEKEFQKLEFRNQKLEFRNDLKPNEFDFFFGSLEQEKLNEKTFIPYDCMDRLKSKCPHIHEKAIKKF